MLTLRRQKSETIVINGPCVIKIIGTGKKNVRLAFDGPKSTKIMRGELVLANARATTVESLTREK
jgi:carbon storage regulator CsrA